MNIVMKGIDKAFGNNKVLKNAGFELADGEVHALMGENGAGRTEIMQAIFGNLPCEKGNIYINGEKVVIKKPAQAIKAGIGFITEDRKTEGLLLEKSITDNIEIANLGKVSVKGVIRKDKKKSLVLQSIEEFRIKCFNDSQECGSLSGGNQQKVVLAKWVHTDPKILILDEPTRGVDIGAKKEIYNVINDMAAKGVAIIMVSSELPEVLGMSDRILVAGTLLGMVSGFLVTKGRLQPFIATLITMTAYRGFALILTNGNPVSRLAANISSSSGAFLFKVLGKGKLVLGPDDIISIPIPVIILIVAFAVMYFVLHHTTFGKRIYATGSNEKCARLLTLTEQKE